MITLLLCYLNCAGELVNTMINLLLCYFNCVGELVNTMINLLLCYFNCAGELVNTSASDNALQHKNLKTTQLIITIESMY